MLGVRVHPQDFVEAVSFAFCDHLSCIATVTCSWLCGLLAPVSRHGPLGKAKVHSEPQGALIPCLATVKCGLCTAVLCYSVYQILATTVHVKLRSVLASN